MVLILRHHYLAKFEKLLKLIAFFDIWVLQGIYCMIKLEIIAA